MALNPRNVTDLRRAGGTAPLTPQNVRKTKYFVHDLRASQLGGVPVNEEGGARVIYLTSVEARYWQEQNAINVKPFEELSEGQQKAADMMTGGKLTAMREERKQRAEEQAKAEEQARVQQPEHRPGELPSQAAQNTVQEKLRAPEGSKSGGRPAMGGIENTSR